MTPPRTCSLEHGRVYYGMGGTSEPDLGLGHLDNPPPTKADMVNNTRAGYSLNNIDFVQTLYGRR